MPRAAKKRTTTTDTYLRRLHAAIDSVDWGSHSTPRLPLEDRGVTPGFLREILEAAGSDGLTPAQLVHGRLLLFLLLCGLGLAQLGFQVTAVPLHRAACQRERELELFGLLG